MQQWEQPPYAQYYTEISDLFASKSDLHRWNFIFFLLHQLMRVCNVYQNRSIYTLLGIESRFSVFFFVFSFRHSEEKSIVIQQLANTLVSKFLLFIAFVSNCMSNFCTICVCRILCFHNALAKWKKKKKSEIRTHKKKIHRFVVVNYHRQPLQSIYCEPNWKQRIENNRIFIVKHLSVAYGFSQCASSGVCFVLHEIHLMEFFDWPLASRTWWYRMSCNFIQFANLATVEWYIFAAPTPTKGCVYVFVCVRHAIRDSNSWIA